MHHRIAAIQMTSYSDVEKNLNLAKKWIEEAAAQGAKLVVLPEMFAVMGIDQIDKVKVREKFGEGVIQDFLKEQAKTYRIWLVGGTIPLAVPNSAEKVYASCLVYDDKGSVAAR